MQINALLAKDSLERKDWTVIRLKWKDEKSGMKLTFFMLTKDSFPKNAEQ